MTQTPLFYCRIGTIPGLCFAVGPTLLFVPTDGKAIHVIRDTVALILTSEVPPLFARHLTETVIEPRLATLGRNAS